MKPLQAMAFGYLFIALYARLGSVDLFADPVGWALVALGVWVMPVPEEIRRRLLTAVGVAFAASVALALPAVVEVLDDADPELAWSVNLPGFVAIGLVLAQLAVLADDADDTRAVAWLRSLVTAVALIAVAPVVVLGAGLDFLGPWASLTLQVVSLAIIFVLFGYSYRPWAAPEAPATEHPTAH